MLAQLQDWGYPGNYRAPGVTMSLVGIEFSREERKLVSFEVAEGCGEFRFDSRCDRHGLSQARSQSHETRRSVTGCPSRSSIPR